MDIKGVGAVVTGGASGLGGATAARLAKAGAKVAIFDMNADLGNAHAKAIGAQFIAVDVTDEAAVGAALAQAETANGKGRILVNCAGIAPGAKVVGRDGKAMPLKDFTKGIMINLVGSFNVLAQFAARLHDAPLLGEERGVIISTSSVAAVEGQIGQAAYSASKGGIVGMMLPIARELARYGIRVNTIAPGLFWTPMMESFTKEVQESLGRQAPFPNRLGKPEEYAQLVQSIVENPMINGETIRLDGALRMAAK
jgi:NAD(P)-dependent dehydrogenase (short-subunit alcohol dehydrogenase family)